MKKNKAQSISGGVSSALLILGTGLIPMSANAVIEEVIVTATKRAADMQDIPVAVSAFTDQQMKMRGLTETSDLMGSVPNLQITSTFAKSQPNFSVRGVGVGNEFNSNAASPVGIYVDEVYQSFRASHGQQLFDMERVEVLRGPQGTLYGRNTTGGAINFITKKPELGENNGYISAGYGNYKRWKLEGAYEATVSDNVGFRLAATREYGDGYVENKTPNGIGKTDKDYNSLDSSAVRLSVVYDMSESTSVNAKFYTAENDPIGDTPIIEGLPGANPPGADHIFGYSRNAEGLGQYEAQADSTGKNHSSADGMVVTVTHELNSATEITAIVGYDEGDLAFDTDCDGSPTDLCSVDYESDSKSLNLDLRAAYVGEGFDLIAGFYYGEDEIESLNKFRLIGALQNDGDPNTDAILIDNGYKQERESLAIYGDANIDLNEAMTLTVGLRYTEDDIAFNDVYALSYDENNQPNAYIIPSVSPYTGPLDGISRSGSSEEVTGRVTLSYHFDDEVMAYMGFSRGYRAGTFNGQSYSSPDQVYFVEPEQVDALELGFKSRLAEGSVQFNGAFFYYDYTNQQVQEIQNTIGFLRNYDGELYGAEFELITDVSDDVRVTAGIGFIESSYDSGQEVSGANIGGNEFTSAPGITASVNTNWVVSRLKDGELIFNGEVQYTDDQYFDSRNDRDNFANGGMRQDSYVLGNARLSYVTSDLTLSAWVKNITDKHYYVYGLVIDGFGYNYLVNGMPRTFGVEVTKDF